MYALAEVAARLQRPDPEDLSEIQLRALIWARCSLAALYGIRIDDVMAGVSTVELDRVD